jgi:hypothetical protein
MLQFKNSVVDLEVLHYSDGNFELEVQDDKIYWNATREVYDIDFNKFASLAKEKYPKCKNILIVNSWYHPLHPCGKKSTDFLLWDEVRIIPACLMYVYDYNGKPAPYSYGHKKFLFLMGKVWKDNRYPVARELHQNRLLTGNLWSFNGEQLDAPPEFKVDKKFFRFAEKNAPIRDMKKAFDSNGSFSSMGKRNKKLYKQTDFEIVAETWCHSYPIITEKTWWPIANRSPFILLGGDGSNELLESLGFKTFEKYLPYPYMKFTDGMDKIIERIVFAKELFATKDFTDIVNHNYNVFVSFAKRHQLLFKDRPVKEIVTLYHEGI